MQLDRSRARQVFEKVESKLKRMVDHLEFGIDLDQYLNERDGDPFDSSWTAAFARLQAVKDQVEPKDRSFLEELSERLREKAFRRIVKKSGNPELAGYVSDDVGIIAESMAVGIVDHWINGLIASYFDSRLPKGGLHETSENLLER